MKNQTKFLKSKNFHLKSFTAKVSFQETQLRRTQQGIREFPARDANRNIEKAADCIIKIMILIWDPLTDGLSFFAGLVQDFTFCYLIYLR